MLTDNPVVTVVIRTFNETKHIGQLLNELAAQKTAFSFEVVVVDSGSTDGTIAIVKQHGARLVQIHPDRFTFGYSLNQGIEAARGQFCAIISAHCHPVDSQWLQHLIDRLQTQDHIGLVYGRQMGNVSTRYSEQQIFNKWFPAESDEDCQLAFCNNANAAIRRSLWVQKPFDETLPGLEDIAWGKYLKLEGYRIAYCAEAVVYHIHEETSRQIYRRYYREALAYKTIFKDRQFTFLHFVKFFFMNVLGDYLHAVRDCQLAKNLLDIPRFRFFQFWGTYRAHRYREPLSVEMQRRLYYPKKPALFKSRDVAQDQAPRYIDISRPLTAAMPVWPGSERVSIQLTKSIEQHGVNETHLSFNLHSGTHLDAPFHFVASGARSDAIPFETLIGEAYVLDCSGSSVMDADFFERAKIPVGVTRILLKTENSHKYPDEGDFISEFSHITSAGARWLVANRIELVGIDGPSIQGYHDGCAETHEILLKANVVILEGLKLRDTSTGCYKLIALPLHIPNVEGAPVRAVLVKV